MAGGSLRVVGVGTVELRVVKLPRLTEQDAHDIFRLDNVLHIPSSRFETIGCPLMFENECNIEWAGGDDMIDVSRQISYFMPDWPLYVIKSNDPPLVLTLILLLIRNALVVVLVCL